MKNTLFLFLLSFSALCVASDHKVREEIFCRHAIPKDSTGFAEHIIKKGVRLGASCEGFGSFLHTAAFFGSTGVAQMLIDKGAPVNTKNDHNMTPLMMASLQAILPNSSLDTREKYRGMTKILLDAKANPNIQEQNTGATPLHQAAVLCDVDAVAMLVKAGANNLLRTNEGKTPLDMAQRFCDQGVVGKMKTLFLRNETLTSKNLKRDFILQPEETPSK